MIAQQLKGNYREKRCCAIQSLRYLNDLIDHLWYLGVTFGDDGKYTPLA
jgi:hypothetical protein